MPRCNVAEQAGSTLVGLQTSWQHQIQTTPLTHLEMTGKDKPAGMHTVPWCCLQDNPASMLTVPWCCLQDSLDKKVHLHVQYHSQSMA
jgi:hypothetical protein